MKRKTRKERRIREREEKKEGTKDQQLNTLNSTKNTKHIHNNHHTLLKEQVEDTVKHCRVEGPNLGRAQSKVDCRFAEISHEGVIVDKCLDKEG